MPKQPTLYTPTGQCCELDEPYQAPVGYFDQPFVYVYDADALPDNQERRFANIKTFTGADFILRRVAGIDRVCTNFQLRDVLARQIFNEPVVSSFHDFPIVPEILYPAGDGITFDLIPVVKTLKVNGGFSVPLSQIVFQGVRRFKGYRRPPSYPYWEDEYSYVFLQRDGTEGIVIDWPASDTNPRRFSIDILDNDFELLQITEVIEESGAPGFNTACKIQLYDQVNEPVFSAPVIDDLIMDNSADYQGIVPVPGIVYRIGQQIRIDVQSLVLAPDLPQTVHLQLHGVRRRPC